MFITRNNVRYDLTANEMLETFCVYELSCDMLYVDDNCRFDEFFENNDATVNKLIFREIALDMRSLIEQADISKADAFKTAYEKYQERVKDSGLPIVDFLKEDLCREVGRRVGKYRHENREYVLEDGRTRVTFTNPNALLDCYLPFLRNTNPNNSLWNWAMEFLEEHR